MKRIKYIILIISFLLSSLVSYSQFISAEIGINGLTCSACSRSVELSLRKLEFVQEVQMNLENTLGTITFKPGSKVNIERIAKAVINAGFSVRYLTAVLKTDTAIATSNNYCFTYGNDTYQFVRVTAKSLQNNITLKFIGKEFLSSKEYKNWKEDLNSQCRGAKTLYFVTL
jgi:copper chaperone CopZ